MAHVNAKAAITSQQQIWQDLMAGNHRFVLGRTLPREIVNSSIIRECKKRGNLPLGQAIYDLDSGQVLRLE